MSRLSDWWKRVIAGYLKWAAKQKPKPEPVPPEPTPEPDPWSQPTQDGKSRASFLFDGARTRVMNITARTASSEHVARIIRRCVANGDNTIYLYAANTGDGSPVPTSIYSDMYGGKLDTKAVELVQDVMRMCRNSGLRIVLWLTADDSDDLSRATRDQHLRHCRWCELEFDELVDEYVVGLEMDSDGRKRHAKAMIAMMKSLTAKPVGVHLNPGKWSDAVKWGADCLFYQFGSWQTDPKKAAKEAESVIKKLGGRCDFVACEYHKSSDSEQARNIGDALLRVKGCRGVGCGAHKAQTPALSGDAIPWDEIDWRYGGENYRDAKLSILDMQARYRGEHDIGFETEQPGDWVPRNVSGKICWAVFCTFFLSGGRWVGGKTEWLEHRGLLLRPVRNIRQGYKGWREPQRGTRMAVCLVSARGEYRSNVVEIEGGWR